MRHAKVQKRTVTPDLVYNNVLVAKFINRMMLSGKKSVAQQQLYGAFDLLKQKDQNPIETFEKALQNVSPRVEVKSRRIGGANYQVPQEVRSDRKMSLAIRWLLEAARKRSNKEYHTFMEKLAQELLDAVQNQGEAVKKKEVMHRQAEANKAFAHFRW